MLDYFALILLFFVGIVLFYGTIVIHDIPYEIAVSRKHPHQDAIHVAGWISLFTLNGIWPFLWIWATLYKPDKGWGFDQSHLEDQMTQIQSRLTALEKNQQSHNPNIDKENL